MEQDRGRSFEDAIAEATARHPDHAEAIAAYHHRWHETILGPIDGTVAILDELSAQGSPLYAITNFTSTSSGRRWPASPSWRRSATSSSRATSGW